MNPFYSYSHNHLTQFTTNSNEIPSPSITPLSSSSHHQQQSHANQQQHTQQQSSQSQFLQAPQSQSSAVSVVAAAASFYARNSGQVEYNSRRHMQSSPIAPPGSFTTNPTPSNLFGGIEDSLFARAEALADINKASHHHIAKQDNLYMAAAAAAANHPANMTNHHLHSMSTSRHSFENDHNNNVNEINERNINHHHHINIQNNSSSISDPNNTFYNAFYASAHHHQPISPPATHQLSQHSAAAIAAAAANAIGQTDIDVDPRELETFAERFKQRRIKLGVTQADVGQQLSKLKLPGVGSLSQSTICRFESLTLSHNNMIALKPVLHSWLEQAENDSRIKRKNDEILSNVSSLTNSSSTSVTSINGNFSINNINNSNNSNHNNNLLMSINNGNSSQINSDRKRKRTSIAAPEKRSLEAFFNVQPRPSGEKIAQIAEKLELKKNVVRVWFCNQRQKQKRMKFNSGQSR